MHTMPNNSVQPRSISPALSTPTQSIPSVCAVPGATTSSMVHVKRELVDTQAEANKKARSNIASPPKALAVKGSSRPNMYVTPEGKQSAAAPFTPTPPKQTAETMQVRKPSMKVENIHNPSLAQRLRTVPVPKPSCKVEPIGMCTPVPPVPIPSKAGPPSKAAPPVPLQGMPKSLPHPPVPAKVETHLPKTSTAAAAPKHVPSDAAPPKAASHTAVPKNAGIAQDAGTKQNAVNDLAVAESKALNKDMEMIDLTEPMEEVPPAQEHQVSPTLPMPDEVAPTLPDVDMGELEAHIKEVCDTLVSTPESTSTKSTDGEGNNPGPAPSAADLMRASEERVRSWISKMDEFQFPKQVAAAKVHPLVLKFYTASLGFSAEEAAAEIENFGECDEIEELVCFYSWVDLELQKGRATSLMAEAAAMAMPKELQQAAVATVQPAVAAQPKAAQQAATQPKEVQQATTTPAVAAAATKPKEVQQATTTPAVAAAATKPKEVQQATTTPAVAAAATKPKEVQQAKAAQPNVAHPRPMATPPDQLKQAQQSERETQAPGPANLNFEVSSTVLWLHI